MWGVLAAVPVLGQQFGVLVEEGVQVAGGVVAAGRGGLDPAAVLADIPDEAVHQRDLATDLPGTPLVQGRPLRRAEAVVVRLAQVGGDGAPPSLTPVRA
jgi:hypothetical protein